MPRLSWLSWRIHNTCPTESYFMSSQEWHCIHVCPTHTLIRVSSTYLHPLQLWVEAEETTVCHFIHKVGIFQSVSGVCKSQTCPCRGEGGHIQPYSTLIHAKKGVYYHVVTELTINWPSAEKRSRAWFKVRKLPVDLDIWTLKEQILWHYVGWYRVGGHTLSELSSRCPLALTALGHWHFPVLPSSPLTGVGQMAAWLYRK